MKKLFTFTLATLTTFFVFSHFASAQVTAVGAQQGLTTFANLITTFNNTVVKALATLFISGAVVAFFFGVTKFIWGLREGKEEVITNGKQFMIWSLVGLFTMFSVYGIIKVAQSLVPGLDSSKITIPDFEIGGNGGSGVSNPSSATNPLQPTIYTCPDGVTKYYNQSDYRIACGGGSSGVTPSSNSASQSSSVYICPDGVTKYYDPSDYRLVCR